MLLGFVVQYWVEFFFSFVIACFGFFIKYTINHLKSDYLDAIKNNSLEISRTNQRLDETQKLFNDKLESLNIKLDDMKENSDANDLAMIRDTLLRKMRYGLTSGKNCTSMADYETVASLFSRYNNLGGNGEVHSIYNKYQKLHICEDVDSEEI